MSRELSSNYPLTANLHEFHADVCGQRRVRMNTQSLPQTLLHATVSSFSRHPVPQTVMKPITRQLNRFRERFARAIDRGIATTQSLNIYINDPNNNYLTAPGTINNNNYNIVNVFTDGTSMGEV